MKIITFKKSFLGTQVTLRLNRNSHAHSGFWIDCVGDAPLLALKLSICLQGITVIATIDPQNT